MTYGLIAGNGRFPILALEEARKLGDDVVVIAIKDEASPDLEQHAAPNPVHWITVAELSKLIDILKRAGARQVMMCGQVKHVNIFSSLRPDWRLAKLLMSLKERNTDALIGSVIKVLADEGIEVVDSTRLLKPLLAEPGVLTRRKPTDEEEKEVRYGRRIAAALSGFDLGQSVAIASRACVALEAMEGTDAMLRRAASLAPGQRITLVKGSQRRGHLLFDVPVAGPGTIATMRETGASILAVDAGRTLLLDRVEMLEAANAAGICVVAE
ncbi:MAG: UDP-2,3-diacylglucosamine diphosphatase LpxI [Bryobacterales bacterium]|nr:UDP-2,3-diacylglucosamine diphosphatase LpxI [Bryobacterales bacterium]